MSNISPTQQLKNLSLTLYAFDLKKGANSLGQLEPDTPAMWERLANFGQDFNIEALVSLQQKLVRPSLSQYPLPIEQNHQHSLLPKGEASISFSVKRHLGNREYQIGGSLSPYQLSNDTDAVDLTLFFSDSISLAQLNQLMLAQLLSSPDLRTALGQTWLLYAEVDAPRKDDRSLSKAVITHTFGDQFLPEYHSEGKLLGHSIFEYSISATASTVPEQVLVWLNHSQLSGEITALTENILYILFARHKILYAYDQACICNQRARGLYSNLEREVVQPFHEISKAPNHLQQFKALLRTQLPQQAFQYAQCLRNLSDYMTTLETNIENYTQKVELLGCSSETDLTFLRDFSMLAENKHKKQVQIYIEYLKPGQALFQQLIDTIRGLAELEQTESDRRLETTIQVLGVGLATSAIVGAGYGYLTKPWKQPFSTNTLHPFVGYLSVSFASAVIMGLITHRMTKRKASASKGKLPR